MKVQVNKTDENAIKPFPKLMKNQDGDIFYFVRNRYGLPLTGQNWIFDAEDFADFRGSGHSFTDFDGSITLYND